MKVPVYKPYLEHGEIASATAALELGWLGMGSYVGEFEAAIGKLAGAGDRHVVAVATGHAALHLALLLMEVGPGDEVITPSFNNIADLQAIAATGATPVFVDVEDDTLSIDLDSVEAMLSPRTRAVIATDYACHLCDHARLAAMAERHGFRVVHDAAHSLGSLYHGKPVGSFSDVTMFSFDPVKTITTIDGGALVVKSEAEARALQEMRLIGMKQAAKVMYGNQRAWNYDVARLGFRYHLANLHAAIGLAQLAKFETIRRTRQDLFRYYRNALYDINELRLPDGDVSDIVPFMFYLRVLGGQREAFREFLSSEGVDTGIHWQPAHGFSFFRNSPRSSLEVTETVGREIVSIPFHSAMPEADRAFVVAKVREFFRAGG